MRSSSQHDFFSPQASLFGLIETTCLLGLAGTWIGSLGRWHWIWDLFAHFRPQYALLSLLVLLFALLRRRRVLAVFAFITLAWNAWLVASVHHTAAGPASGPALRVMTFNVLTSNPHPQQAIQHVLDADPDIVLLLEPSASWSHFLEPLRKKYPHRLEDLAYGGNFGIACYTRLPVKSSRILHLVDESIPSIQIECEHAGQPLTFIGTHPIPPMTRENALRYRTQLSLLSKLVAAIPHRVIVAGDLNATPWSEGMRLLKSESGLDFHSAAPVWLPTWGRHLPMMMPIDHILTRTGLQVTQREIGPDLSSDHRSILVELR